MNTEESKAYFSKFRYYLADYDENPIDTLAPLHVGDYINISRKIVDDGDDTVEKRKVLRVEHLISQMNSNGDQTYSSMVYLEEKK